MKCKHKLEKDGNHYRCKKCGEKIPWYVVDREGLVVSNGDYGFIINK